MAEKIKTDPELKELLPPLTEWEFEQLEMNILASPERVAVVVWREREVLLDGHNRYAICHKHKLPYRVDQVSLPNMDAAKLWVINEHLGRRHFSETQKNYWMGKQLEYQKKQHGGDRKSTTYQNGTLIEQDKQVLTRQTIAKQHHVGEQTVERNMRLARNIDTIAAVAGDEVKNAILADQIRMTRQEVQEVAKIAEAQPQTAKAVLTQIKASHKRQDTKQIVEEASRQLPKSSRPKKQPLKSNNPHTRYRKRMVAYAEALAALPQPVHIKKVAEVCNQTVLNAVRNATISGLAVLPWLEVTPAPRHFYHFKINRYLRAVCEEGVGAKTPADIKAFVSAFGDLLHEIDRQLEDMKINRADDWNPVVVQKVELVYLITFITTELKKLTSLG